MCEVNRLKIDAAGASSFLYLLPVKMSTVTPAAPVAPATPVAPAAPVIYDSHLYSRIEYDAYYADIADRMNWCEHTLRHAKKERSAYVAQAAWSDEDCACVDELDALITDTQEYMKDLIDALNH